MSVLLGHNIKIFVTENVDNKGYVKSNGFTSANTKQLLISTGSFTFSQEHTAEIVDLSLGIGSNAENEGYAGGYTSAGTLNLRCLLNSSKSDSLPFDKILWDSITKDTTYPTGWTSGTGFTRLPLNRTIKNIKPFGIFAIVDGITYIFDACRISTVSILLDIKELSHVGWAATYIKQRRISGVVLDTTDLNTFILSGTLSGTCARTDLENYNIAASKLMRTTLTDRDTNTVYTIASTNSAITITNAQIFIENVNMEADVRTALFAGAGNYSISATVSFYTRKAGDSFNLVNHITNNELASSGRHEYTLKIEVLDTTGLGTLAEILLDGVRLTLSETAGTVLVSTAGIKVFNSAYNANSGIKFCS